MGAQKKLSAETERDRRRSERKSIDFIAISDLTVLNNYKLIASRGYITDASTTGFKVEIARADIASSELKQNLNMETLIGESVLLFLPQMNLDLDGKVTRAIHIGRGNFEIGIDFSAEVPEYWRECLMELLPSPGELDIE